jgi:hypothetical protein
MIIKLLFKLIKKKCGSEIAELPGGVKPLIDSDFQEVYVDRFCYIIIHSGSQAPFSVLHT